MLGVLLQEPWTQFTGQASQFLFVWSMDNQQQQIIQGRLDDDLLPEHATNQAQIFDNFLGMAAFLRLFGNVILDIRRDGKDMSGFQYPLHFSATVVRPSV